MASDELGTISTFHTFHKDVFLRAAQRFQGRVIKLIGDGILMEFVSVVDAVRFAVEVQADIARRNEGIPDDKAMMFRIGINIGDVIAEGDDVLGNGVNVAARLEAMADAGGICISRTVHDHVAGSVDCSFEDLGLRQFKNIPEPIQVFRVLFGAAKSGLTREPVAGMMPFLRRACGIAALILAAAVGTYAWYTSQKQGVEIASSERRVLPLPDKPSIAVLPFSNISGDSDQDQFADGMTDDLITDLSKLSGLFVIARNSSFAYKDRTVEIHEVAEELGVRYLVEGSVRRAGDQVRINAQLVDATTGGQIWADRYDGAATEVFAVQDAFIRQIVDALSLQFSAQEKVEIAAGQTDTVEAREAFQRGWELYVQYSRTQNTEAIPHFEKAIELDPQYGRAYAALALIYNRSDRLGWERDIGVSWSELDRRRDHYTALAEQHPSSLAHIARSRIHLDNSKHALAFEAANMAVSADPNDPEGYIALGLALALSGKPVDAQGFIKRAIRLNPVYPPQYALALGIAYLADDDYENAAKTLAEGLDRNPRAVELAAPLAAMHGLLGNRREARANLLLWRPTADDRTLELLQSNYRFPYRWSSDAVGNDEKLRDGLHIAALPLDVTVPDLIAGLDNDNLFEQLNAVRRLGHFRSLAGDAVPSLVRLLETDVDALLMEVINSLGKIGPKAESAAPELRKLLARDTLVRAKAQTALDLIVPEN